MKIFRDIRAAVRLIQIVAIPCVLLGCFNSNRDSPPVSEYSRDVNEVVGVLQGDSDVIEADVVNLDQLPPVDTGYDGSSDRNIGISMTGEPAKGRHARLLRMIDEMSEYSVADIVHNVRQPDNMIDRFDSLKLAACVGGEAVADEIATFIRDMLASTDTEYAHFGALAIWYWGLALDPTSPGVLQLLELERDGLELGEVFGVGVDNMQPPRRLDISITVQRCVVFGLGASGWGEFLQFVESKDRAGYFGQNPDMIYIYKQALALHEKRVNLGRAAAFMHFEPSQLDSHMRQYPEGVAEKPDPVFNVDYKVLVERLESQRVDIL